MRKSQWSKIPLQIIVYLNIKFLAFHTAPGYDTKRMLESTSEK